MPAAADVPIAPTTTRRFPVALAVLGAGALGLCIGYYWGAGRTAPQGEAQEEPREAVHSESSLTTSPPVPAASASPTASPTPIATEPLEPPPEVKAAEEEIVLAAEKSLVVSLPKPTPLPLLRPTPRPTPPPPVVTPQSRANGLVQMARTLRERGDMSTALTRLREAQALVPNHALIISEMALTYEKMQLIDKAIEQWRRIYDFGEKAGIYYTAAEAKLRSFQLPDPRMQQQEGAYDLIPSSLQGLQGGLPGETPLTLGRVGTTHDTGNSAPMRRLRLRVPIHAQPGPPIDVEEVVIQVFFYDRLGDGNIVETNADVSSAWARRVTSEGEAMVDFGSSEPEVLEVDYAQIETRTATPGGTESRNYFGYVVRVYYKGLFNAAHAEPHRLLDQFPPPQTLSPSDLPQ